MQRERGDRMNYDVKNLKEILQMSQEELKSHLEGVLQEKGYHTQNRKGYLYAPGKVPVLLVAHLDTVHTMKPDIICFSEDGRFVMSPQGIGGDDRCGVYMILQIIQDARCHVLFCEDEETGGNGARAFTRSRLRVNVNYIVEMDRRGNNDAVFYQCDNPDFTDFILSYGFEEKTGSFSDISVVAPHLEAAAVNISAGYYNKHRPHECIDMLAVENNIQRIKQMVLTETEPFPFIQRKSSYHQFSLFGGQRSLLDFSESGECRQKLLMDLPDTARLISNGYEIAPQSTYLIDRESNVYIYLDELKAAVESEYAYACDENGDQIVFSVQEARRFPVLSMEAALEQLSMI